jgi:hypothetical protein
MKLLGFEIIKLKRHSKLKMVSCFHCGKEFQTGADNFRAYNYCSSC